MIGLCTLVAALLTANGPKGVEFALDADRTTIDPARSVFVTLKVTSKAGALPRLPDLRERAVGFAQVEDFADEPVQAKNGTTVQTVNWRLVPEPCAEVYKLRPMVVGDGDDAFVVGPFYFENPPPREVVTGGMEVDPQKVLPPLSWRLVGQGALVLAALVLVIAAIWYGSRYLTRRIKEHRMSPIERAWVELDRLLKRGLPGRGRYKDFYVELTMVVRRYIQRKYGICAPNLTTEEFLHQLGELGGGAAAIRPKELQAFLESSDLVKFAGVEATPEMADGATASARKYLESDHEARVP